MKVGKVELGVSGLTSMLTTAGFGLAINQNATAAAMNAVAPSPASPFILIVLWM